MNNSSFNATYVSEHFWALRGKKCYLATVASYVSHSSIASAPAGGGGLAFGELVVVGLVQC